MSADYDKITGLFEDLALYLNRLKILENKVPLVQELEMTLIEVLISVLLLCGISAKYVRMKRIGKENRVGLIASNFPEDVSCVVLVYFNARDLDATRMRTTT